MKKLINGVLASALLLPFTVFAEDWTKEQQEVLAFEEACIGARDAETMKACFHEDYVGWGMASPVPLSKRDLVQVIDETFATSQSESVLFKPLSVIVKGDVAVVTYIDSGKVTDKATDEVEYYVQRWTDVCLKDGGQWYWISDHGVDITNDE